MEETMLNNSGNSKVDTLLKLVLIFVMSVLSFSIGAYVGKQVSDTEYRQALLESEHSGAGRSTASINPKATDQKPENALSEEDIESLTEEFVNVEKKSLEEKHTDMPNPVETHKYHDAHNKGKMLAKNEHHGKDGYKKFTRKKDKHDAVPHDTQHKEHKTAAVEKPSQAALRVAQGKAPVKDPVKKRSPDTVLPVSPQSSVGKYTVQVASYATEEEAKKHINKLKSKGYSAFYIPANVRGKTWYRVSVGLFKTKKSATSFRAELETEAGVKSSIIQKIVR
jgi:cell division protein FtsN